MPAARCQAKKEGQGKDFMSSESGTGQAMQVMTQKKLGGQLYEKNCDYGGGQSEHVAFYMPEVAALSMFLSTSELPQVDTPVWVLGARPLFDLVDGTAWSVPLQKPFKQARFTSDLAARRGKEGFKAISSRWTCELHQFRSYYIYSLSHYLSS